MERIKLKDMTYYTVEVSFFDTNPIHRAVCFHQSNGCVNLFGSYDGIKKHNIEHLAFFRVLEEIDSMNENGYKNQYKQNNHA